MSHSRHARKRLRHLDCRSPKIKMDRPAPELKLCRARASFLRAVPLPLTYTPRRRLRLRMIEVVERQKRVEITRLLPHKKVAFAALFCMATLSLSCSRQQA